METANVTEQAPAQQPAPSVEERIANIFGKAEPTASKGAPPAPKVKEPELETATDTENEAAPEAETTESTEEATSDAPAPETFEFEHEGEKWTLPKKLEKAFQNNKDYTQKTQEVANQRRSLEVLNEQAKALQLTRAFESSVASELQQLAAYDSVLSQPMDLNATEGQILKEMVQRNQWKDQREQLARSVNEKHQKYMQDYEKAQSDIKAKALDAVTKRIPGFNDAIWTSIKDHAKADGYTDSELSNITDPRHQVTLWKAQQYDAMKSKASKTVTTAKAVKTTPSNPMPQAVKDKLAFRKEVSKLSPGSPQHQQLVRDRISKMFG